MGKIKNVSFNFVTFFSILSLLLPVTIKAQEEVITEPALILIGTTTDPIIEDTVSVEDPVQDPVSIQDPAPVLLLDPVEEEPITPEINKYVKFDTLKTAVETEQKYFEQKRLYKQVIDQINVHQSKKGWGYQTVNKFSDRIEYIGYGEDSEDYTYTVYTILVSSRSSTSTSGVNQSI